jgi:hypothetical protein
MEMPYPGGSELLISRISGRTSYVEEPLEGTVIDPTNDTTISGKYMAVTLGRLFINLPMYKIYGEELRHYVILGAVWQNLWDYPLNVNFAKMIDSEGFQHSGDICVQSTFEHVYKPSTNEIFDAKFTWPELTLEAYAKTRGWIWYEALPESIVPRRFIFSFDIFDPGRTSGYVRDTEKLAFNLMKFEQTEFDPSSLR